MKQLDAMYEKFTPSERVALMVEALARKDYPEADRLIDTCERKRYEMADASYTEAFRYIHTMALHARILLLQAHGAGLLLLGLLDRDSGDTSRVAKKRFSDGCDRLKQIDARMRGIWLAWEKFCSSVGVNPERAFSMGWSEAPQEFKVGIAAAFLGVEPPEPSEEAYGESLSLFLNNVDSFKQYGAGMH